MMKLVLVAFVLALAVPQFAVAGEGFQPPSFDTQTGQLTEPIVKGEVAQSVFLTPEAPQLASFEIFGSLAFSTFAIIAGVFALLYAGILLVQRYRRRHAPLSTY